MAEVVEVYSAPSEPEACLLVQKLADHGIDARIGGATLRTAMGEIPVFHTEPRIWVVEADADLARWLLRGWERKSRESARSSSRQCPICTAEVDESFQICWSCQRGREEWE